MVMISFKIDKQLQTVSNYFLFSLAVADIVVGKGLKKSFILNAIILFRFT